MSRYRGPRVRIRRRLGELPGLTNKVTTKQSAPGQHGLTKKKKNRHNMRFDFKKNKNYALIMVLLNHN